MFKRSKQLAEVIHRVDALQTTIDKLSDQVNALVNRKPTRYKELPLVEGVTDYEQLKVIFEEKYYKDAMDKFHGIKDNLQECIIQYDKILYFNKASINFIEVISKLYELYTLKSFILKLLFNTTDIKSFYFYAINNRTFYDTVIDIPYIDMDKIFLLDYQKELDVSYYVIVNMHRDRIVIVSPNGEYEMENRYRKTVVRSLFSIYFEKYYLYHLGNTNGEGK